jgi:Ca2+:H+ antiporter
VKNSLDKVKSLIHLNEIQTIFGFILLIYAVTVDQLSRSMVLAAALFLALGISSAVHNAEAIAKRIGPSLGTLVLALSVTIIEVALIVNLMGDPLIAATIARDTVFAAIMIVTNGIAGISILLGSLKHKELGFQPHGTSSLMAVLVTLSVITMVLPNFTTTTIGPTYSLSQLIFVSVFSLVVYFALLWAQTKTNKDYFEFINDEKFQKLEIERYVPSKIKNTISFVGLFFSLIVVVGLAKVLSPSISEAVSYIGAPQKAVGIIVALLVLAPETLAALNSAKANQLQTSFNLALGSGAASIALTIPVVTFYSILTNQSLSLGLDSKSIVFLALTFIAGSFTFGSGRTTALNGIVHLIILFSYLVLAFIP